MPLRNTVSVQFNFDGVWKTPSGMPHSRAASSISSVVSGVISDGLMITALPAISAGMASQKELASG